MKSYICNVCEDENSDKWLKGSCMLSCEDSQIVSFCPVDKGFEAEWEELVHDIKKIVK